MPQDLPFIVRDCLCPCDCDSNGELVYLSCPNCGKVVLACDEIGNVFDNLSDPLASTPLVLWRSSGQSCPGCQGVCLAEFKFAGEAELNLAGVARKDIEAGGAHVAGRIRYLASR